MENMLFHKTQTFLVTWHLKRTYLLWLMTTCITNEMVINEQLLSLGLLVPLFQWVPNRSSLHHTQLGLARQHTTQPPLLLQQVRGGVGGCLILHDMVPFFCFTTARWRLSFFFGHSFTNGRFLTGGWWKKISQCLIVVCSSLNLPKWKKYLSPYLSIHPIYNVPALQQHVWHD